MLMWQTTMSLWAKTTCHVWWHRSVFLISHPSIWSSFFLVIHSLAINWKVDYHGWLVVWNMFFRILGISSSQLTLTPSFFRGVGQPPTRWCSRFAFFFFLLLLFLLLLLLLLLRLAGGGGGGCIAPISQFSRTLQYSTQDMPITVLFSAASAPKANVDVLQQVKEFSWSNTRFKEHGFVWKLGIPKSHWPFQEPKLEVPTIYKAYVRPM